MSLSAPLERIIQRARRLLHSLVPRRHARGSAEIVENTSQADRPLVGPSPAGQADRARVARVTASACQHRRQATRGGRPRCVAVPAAGTDAFADLDIIGTLDKNTLTNTPVTTGVGPADMDVRLFGRRVARRFGRFPFPDEVVPWLTPLTDVVTGKYGKATGEALALGQVVELRVEATGGWTAPPYSLTLVTIVRAGTLPELEEEDQIDPPSSARRWLREPNGGLRRASGEIANRLFAHELDSWGDRPHQHPPSATISG